MTEQKQIEDMAKVIGDADQRCYEIDDCDDCPFHHIELGLCKERFVADALYSAGYHKQEWISVKEELPEDFEAVLLYVNDGGYEGVCIGYYYGGWSVMGVTHWMPLPMPPKGDEGK